MKTWDIKQGRIFGRFRKLSDKWINKRRWYRERERKGSSLLPVSPLPRLSFHLHPPTTAILYLPLPPPLTVRWTLAAMVVVEVAVEVATAAAIATAAVAPPPTLRSSCLLSLSASTLLFPSTGAQSVVAVGVRWLKGNRFESGATPIKDKHVSWSTCSGLAAGSRFQIPRFRLATGLDSIRNSNRSKRWYNGVIWNAGNVENTA